ncbi:MAG: trypsin-like peptidase domain-containing protein [Methylobacterium sp.]|nr:trypsin-like peptidase domain-containing protein [Methylobacterium sp.]
MRILALLLSIMFAACFPARSQAPDNRLLEFYASLDPDIRVNLQRALMWADAYVGIADGSFDRRSIEAVRTFQRNLNQAPTGMLTGEQVKELAQRANRIEAAFNYRLHHDSATGVTVGLPMTFVDKSAPTRRGTQFTSQNGEVDLTTIRIPLAERTLSDLYRLHTTRSGRKVSYSVFRGDWFVVTGVEANKHFYIRAHAWGDDIRGFAISYPEEHAKVFGRLSTVMSSDFKPDSSAQSVAQARMNWGNFSNRFATAQPQRPAPAPGIVAAAPPTPQPPSPPVGGPSEPAKGGVSTGTGFLVSSQGHFLTNAHVVEQCRQVGVGVFGNATVVDRDKTNDLALLKVDAVVKGKPLTFSQIGPRLGEEVMALGYPLPSLLQNGLNVTKGDVSSLAGIGGDSRFLQFTAAIQPGNSGGPLVNRRGAVLGVVTSKLNAIRVASAVGDIPQSINFAIRPELAELYLRRHGIAIARAPDAEKPMEAHELVAAIQDAVSLVICTQ